MAKRPTKNFSTRFVKIADFDAALLAVADVASKRMDLLHVVNVGAVVEPYTAWEEDAARISAAAPRFYWPSVYTFHPDALTVALGGPTQLDAMMQLAIDHHVRCPGGSRGPLAYVAFLEVAPWNKPHAASRKFRGLGTLLLQIASSWSLENGTDGVIGLHALPAVVPFYQKLGFDQVYCPNEHHELYFEMSAPRAAKFRSEGGLRP